MSIIEYWCRLLKQHLKNRTNVILKIWVCFCIYSGPHSYIHTFSKEPSAISIIRAGFSMQVPWTVIMLGCCSNLEKTKIQEAQEKFGIQIFFYNNYHIHICILYDNTIFLNLTWIAVWVPSWNSWGFYFLCPWYSSPSLSCHWC